MPFPTPGSYTVRPYGIKMAQSLTLYKPLPEQDAALLRLAHKYAYSDCKDMARSTSGPVGGGGASGVRTNLVISESDSPKGLYFGE